MNSTKPLRPLSNVAGHAGFQRAPSLGMQVCPPLSGLEVRDSSFGEWLAAGGERRSRPRSQTTEADLAKRGQGANPESALDRLQPALVRR